MPSTGLLVKLWQATCTLIVYKALKAACKVSAPESSMHVRRRWLTVNDNVKEQLAGAVHVVVVCVVMAVLAVAGCLGRLGGDRGPVAPVLIACC